MQLEDRDYAGLADAWKYTASQTAENVNMTLWYSAIESIVPQLIQQAIMLSQKYDVVVTNPPYMSTYNASMKVQEYIKRNFPDSKTDLFAVFIERCGQMAKKTGYQAMITQHVWMFIASFEQLRIKLLSKDIVNMIHLGARAFDEIAGEVVQTAAFVIAQTSIDGYSGTYCRLLSGNSENEKESIFLSEKSRFITPKKVFSIIPRTAYVYWVSKELIVAFKESAPLRDFFTVRNGLTTGDNSRFLRLWYEVKKSSVERKWFFCNKGGAYRRWYGNNDYLINWEKDGYALKHFTDERTGKLRATLRNIEFNFRPSIVVGHVASGDLPYRYVGEGFISESAVNSIYPINKIVDPYYALAALNSKPCNYISAMLNPTLGVSPEDVQNIPLRYDNSDIVITLSSNNVDVSRNDWNAFETSWDFKLHPLVAYSKSVAKAEIDHDWSNQSYYLKNAYEAWDYQCKLRFDTLKANEEELNRIFIDIYGLQDELTPEGEDKDVTVRLADKKRDIRSLISYAVGCMFGRYSLYKEGLFYAGGPWDYGSKVDLLSDCAQAAGIHPWNPSALYLPDRDNVIPICDDEYFDDDIVARFVRFIEVVCGKETLDENLRFIADALGGSGQPKDIIRSYFLNDFYADHLKIYQKRPIYWLFDSGKKGGFKALIYMHRYQPDTIARIRTDYVFEQQARYRTAIADLEQRMANASTSERVKLTKQLQKLQMQDAEIRAYEEKIHHLADQMIPIDLDDGVKHNYEIFKDVLAPIE